MKRPANQLSIYKSPEGRAAIMQWYDEQVAGFSASPEPRWIDTSFGRTHLLVGGPAKAPPLFVLHGMNLNAATMGVAMGRLTGVRRVYAVDIIGMPGKSAGARPSRTGQGYALWLNEVMEALEVPQADFVGQSFGGWLILGLAAIMPIRVDRIVLLDSGGLVPFTMSGQIVAGIAALRYMIRPNAQNLKRAVRPLYAPNVSLEPRLMELLGLTYRHTRMDIDLHGLPTFNRKDFTGLSKRVFVSYGAHDIFFKAERAIRKAKEIWSDSVEPEVVDNEGHLLSEKGEHNLYDRVAIFLERNAA